MYSLPETQNPASCKIPVTLYPLTNAQFPHINIHILGSLPSSQGYRYLLTMVDCFTHWPEAVPMKDATTHSCAQAFLATWISRFEIPAHLSSDCSQQFTSAIWASFYQALGILLHHTTAFRPCGTVSQALKKCSSGSPIRPRLGC